MLGDFEQDVDRLAQQQRWHLLGDLGWGPGRDRHFGVEPGTSKVMPYGGCQEQDGEDDDLAVYRGIALTEPGLVLEDPGCIDSPRQRLGEEEASRKVCREERVTRGENDGRECHEKRRW